MSFLIFFQSKFLVIISRKIKSTSLEKPSDKILKWYAAYAPELIESKDGWFLRWTEEKIKKYYLEGLLLHEIGHQVDSVYKRFWSSNYKKQKAENFADNFAYYW